VKTDSSAINIQHVVLSYCGIQKDKTSSKTTFGAGNGGPSKDREPASWRWDKQELERQIKDLKKKNDELMAAQSPNDGKKTASKLAASKLAGDAKVMPSTDDELLVLCMQTKFGKLYGSLAYFWHYFSARTPRLVQRVSARPIAFSRNQ
jgi:hypothetical protein